MEENGQNDEDEDFSLHFQLAEVKLGLAEIRDKMEEVRTGTSRSRGSGELGHAHVQACCFDPAGVL